MFFPCPCDSAWFLSVTFPLYLGGKAGLSGNQGARWGFGKTQPHPSSAARPVFSNQRGLKMHMDVWPFFCTWGWATQLCCLRSPCHFCAIFVCLNACCLSAKQRRELSLSSHGAHVRTLQYWLLLPVLFTPSSSNILRAIWIYKHEYVCYFPWFSYFILLCFLL